MTSAKTHLAWLALGLLGAASPMNGQVPGLPAHSNAAETPPAVETPEQTEVRLQQWLKEARLTLSRMDDLGENAKYPDGIDPGSVSDYRRDLEMIALGVSRHRKILILLPEARKALDAAREADLAWTGFPEKPPYSILFIDELVEQRDLIKERASSFRSSLQLSERTLASILDEARVADDVRRRIVTEVSESRDTNEAAKWRLVAQKNKGRLLALRAKLLESQISLMQTQAETADIELALLDRQIQATKNQGVFSDEDLAKVKKAAADRQAALRKEIAATRKRQEEATTARTRLIAAVDTLTAALPEGEDPAKSSALVLAKLKLEAGETRVEALQFVIEALESIVQLEPMVPDAYQDRKILIDESTPEAKDKALRSIRTLADRLKAYGIVEKNNLNTISADIHKQESRASLIAAEDPRLVPINDQRAALWEKQTVAQRLLQVVSSQRRMLQRWLSEFDAPEVEKTAAMSASTLASAVLNRVTSLWDFPVFHLEETLMIEGVASTEKRGVAFGRIIMALLFFLTAYFIAKRIKKRLQHAVVSRGRLAEAQANTLGNWMMILVGVGLVLLTLHFLRIPLTVFAFLGGALAIGLGFGSQTLIKNFISGIIVLFERKIRVGDVVEVGGISGSIIEINTRSSVLSSPDGRETLVPNSVFLETSITNLTLANRVVRRFINIGVAYGSPVDLVSKVLSECAERHGLIQKDPKPLVILQDFGDNAMLFKLYFWFEMAPNVSPELVESDLRMMIEKSFRDVGISFPFPQRDLHLTTLTPLQVAIHPAAN